MELFNDIEFEDDDESIIGHYFDNQAKKDFCNDYVKLYSDFYGQHLNCSLTYEIVYDQLACFVETRNNKITASENKNNDMYDGFVLPFDKTDIILMIKFDSAYHIEYIRGKIITYNPSKSGKGIDEELFLLRYANDLMNNHGCIIDEIIFTDEEEESAWTLDLFNITMCYNRREAVANTPPLSEDFCKQFPKLSFMIPNKPLTNSLSFDRCHFASEKAFIYACNRLHEMYPKMAMSFNVATTYFGGHALWEGDQYFNDAFLKVVSLFEYKKHIDDYILIDINKLNKCLEQMNESLYNKIITKISKIVKESINEAYDVSIYDRYISSDDQSILNHSGKIGDILQINQYGDQYRVKSANSINESMFDDIDFDDDYSVSVSDKLTKWKDLAKCFGKGLWVYLDWIGLNKRLIWARKNTKLYKDNIPDTNGYENTQYILNNYKNCIKRTIWEEIQKCKYNVYIPDKNQLKRIYKVNEKYNLSLSPYYYWSSSQYADSFSDYYDAFKVDFSSGSVYSSNKTSEYRSVALLHF